MIRLSFQRFTGIIQTSKKNWVATHFEDEVSFFVMTGFRLEA
jgi:hypothetical protein